MKQLSYDVLKEQQYPGYLLEEAPERILQFGEGNFLRAFVDYFVDVMNEKAGFNGKAVLLQPRPQSRPITVKEQLNAQDGLYTLYLRGFEHGQKINSKRVISSVSRCLNAHSDYADFLECAKNPALRYITSNTTEAGIVYDPACRLEDQPAASFPGKLTQFLYRRYELFGNEPGKGFVILPCELIDENGKVLKDCVLRYAKQWNLGDGFLRWLEQENYFCSTLVDRIVTGYPASEVDDLNRENGYEDQLLTTGEVFGFWVIEGPSWLKEELPFEKAGLPILLTDNHKPYKQRKVRILNGAHTSMVLGAYLAGQDIVRDCMEDDVIRGFMNKAIYEEIIPTLPLPADELESFAFSVTERFKNPFIDHALLSISLNSTAKWKARVLPTVLDYIQTQKKLPKCLTASLAFYIAFYRGKELTAGKLHAVRPKGDSYTISDDPQVLNFFLSHKDDPAKELAQAVCKNKDFWGIDLSTLPGFQEEVAECLEKIEKNGAYELMKECLN